MPLSGAAGNQAIESLTDRLYQMYMLHSSASVTVSEEKKRERISEIIDYVDSGSAMQKQSANLDAIEQTTSIPGREKTSPRRQTDEKTVEAFQDEHAAEIQALRMHEAIERDIAKRPTLEQLKVLTAQKMILYQSVKTFLADEDQGKLGKALEKESFNTKVSEMMDSKAFQQMCRTLGTQGLAQAATMSGEALVSTFAKTLEAQNVLSVQASPKATPEGPAPKEVSGPSLF